MGLCGSKSSASVAASSAGSLDQVVPKKIPEARSEFDKRMALALQRYQAKSSDIPKSERVSSFNQVLLRSGRIVSALDAVRQVFKKFDVDGSNSMDHSELTEALKVLGNDVSEEDAKKVFHEADLYNNNKLSEKEFVVCLLLGYVLGDLKLGNNETTTDDASAAEVVEGIERKNTEAFYGHAKELQWAFNNIIGTYLLFDVDASGDLSKIEVMKQLQAKTGVFADASAAQILSEERWKELDWDGDGQISFREFIWAFQGWISNDGEGDNE